MLRAFNMGVVIVVCAGSEADRVLSSLREHGEPAAFRMARSSPATVTLKCSGRFAADDCWRPNASTLLR